MTRRIDKVLQFARIGSRGRIYELQLANLSSIVTGVLDRWRSRFEQQGVQIEADVANGVPLVNMDPAAVSDALLNLLDNAAKYSDASRPVHVLVFARSRHAVLEVRDYGPGIPQSEQSHLFEAFYRNPRDSGKGGFGLGLFLVKHIVEGHGGAVELDSKPGQGSSFRLLFPLHEQDPDRRG
jgi:signal transduction histidine kinase